jgi:acyl-CoA reductase-like NAD-dependent aldehyde dehydrogenase
MALSPDLPPAVVVRGLADARTVLAAAAGRPVLLLSPPAARLLGPAWWVAMLAEAGAGAIANAFDCADEAGTAQAALAAGAGGIVFTGDAALAARLASIAARRGTLFLSATPPALDMGAYGALRRLPGLFRAPE